MEMPFIWFFGILLDKYPMWLQVVNMVDQRRAYARATDYEPSCDIVR